MAGRHRGTAVAASVLALGLPLSASGEGLPSSPPRFTVSAETTRVTSPLLPDGTPDYAAALDAHFGAGVTGGNNAAPLLEPEAAQVVGWLGQAPALARLVRPRVPEAPASDEELALRFHGEWLRGSAGPWTAAELPLLAAWLEGNREPLARVAAAAERPRFFPRPFAAGSPEWGTAPIPSVLPLRLAANALRARALQRLASGDAAGALADLVTGEKLAALLARGPELVHGLLGAAVRGIVSEAVPVVAFGKPRSPELKAAVASLEALPPRLGIHSAEAVDRTERYRSLSSLVEMARRGPTAWKTRTLARLTADERALGDELLFPYPAGFERVPVEVVDWDEALRWTNRCWDRLAAALRDGTPPAATDAPPSAASPADLDSLVARARSSAEARRELSRLFSPETRAPRTGISSNEADAQLRMALVALAQAAFRAERGAWAPDLAALAPAFLRSAEGLEGPRGGYSFDYRVLDGGAGFVYRAVPTRPGVTGFRSFCLDDRPRPLWSGPAPPGPGPACPGR